VLLAVVEGNEELATSVPALHALQVLLGSGRIQTPPPLDDVAELLKSCAEKVGDGNRPALKFDAFAVLLFDVMVKVFTRVVVTSTPKLAVKYMRGLFRIVDRVPIQAALDG
jgi:hypothetical protein